MEPEKTEACRKTANAVAIFDKCARLYQDKFRDTSLYHDSFDLFCGHIPDDNAAILDIACGPGNITRYLLDKRPGFRILGIDLAPNMIALAGAGNPEAAFRLMDCRDILQLNSTFDGIMCGFCLPYLSKEDAIQLIGNAAQLLNPGGVLCLSTMEDDYGKSGLKTGSSGDRMYIHYHEENYLIRALEEHGFRIEDLRRKQYADADGTTTTDLIIIGKLV